MYVVISDPELTEFFISSPKFLTKTWDYDRFRPWIANGLLISTGGVLIRVSLNIERFMCLQ